MNGWSKAAFAVSVLLTGSCADRGRAVDANSHAPPVISHPAALRGVASPIVLVTIDGVRWQEVYEGSDPALSGKPMEPAASIFPNLYRLGTERGAFIGAPGHGTISATGPEFVSLPGYNEIFGGRSPTCQNNQCPRTTQPTFLDHAHERGASVAAFGSWEKLDLAFTAHPGAFYASVGRGDPPAEPLPGTTDSRPDRATAEAALAFYAEERPDVFYLGLGDPDEHAHHGDYAAYLASLKYADETLGRLVAILDGDERGRQTHVFVTPDHGRASSFRHHGGFAPEAARTWMVAAGPRITAHGRIASPVPRRLADIAPTMRVLAGMPVAAATTPGVGVPMAELFASPRIAAGQ